MNSNFIKQRLKKYIVSEISVPESLVDVTHIDHDREVAHRSERVNQVYAEIWQAIEGLYQSGMQPGISFCLRHQGEVRINRSIGHISGNGPHDGSDSEKVPLQPNSPICLFSASKAITAMLIHKLVEEGEVHLDDPISKYIQGFRGSNSPSVIQILSHQAGIPRMPAEVGIEAIFDYEQMVDLIVRLKPDWIAGQKIGYHAVTGGYLLGEIVRSVTQTSVQEYLRETLGFPLGMSFFGYGVSRDQLPQLAKNYFTGLPVTPPFSTVLTNALGMSVEEIVEVSNDPRFNSAVVPAANLMATAEEVSRFYQLLLDNGVYNSRQIFKPDTILLAKRAQGSLVIDHMLKVPMRYSAGMMLGESPMSIFGPFTKNAFGHLGFTNNLCWADPDRSLSVGFLCTGKAVIGPHLPKIVKLLVQIAKLPK